MEYADELDLCRGCMKKMLKIKWMSDFTFDDPAKISSSPLRETQIAHFKALLKRCDFVQDYIQAKLTSLYNTNYPSLESSAAAENKTKLHDDSGNRSELMVVEKGKEAASANMITSGIQSEELQKRKKKKKKKIKPNEENMDGDNYRSITDPQNTRS